MKRETCPVCGNKTRDKKGLLHEHANEPPQKYFFAVVIKISILTKICEFGRNHKFAV